MEKNIYLAGGCFWGVEKYLSSLEGVLNTSVGYANGHTGFPTYEEVCHRATGHVETVRVSYDPNRISLRDLLDDFFEVVDPTAVNRQGPDVGTQYRSGIYYVDASDRPLIEEALQELQGKYEAPVAVEFCPLQNFYPAEEYHQKYLDKNPGGYCHIPAEAFRRANSHRSSPFCRKTDQELKAELYELQYQVTQNGMTERPFENEYDNWFQKGIYVDITTGEPLFLSSDKFESGCGWPAFSKPIRPSLLKEQRDTSHGMERVEVRSRGGNAHLGHVFSDGPLESGGLRYCINSAALKFIPFEEMAEKGYGGFLSLFDSEEK